MSKVSRPLNVLGRVPSSRPFLSSTCTELSCSLLAEVCTAADHSVDSVF